MQRFQHWFFGPARSTRVQFFRYFWVGGISTVVDFSVYVVCLRILGIHYLVAQFIAYCFGFATNYILAILWVFARTDKFFREITTVFIITLFGLLWTELLLYLFVDGFGWGEVMAKVIATIIVLFWNFGARRYFVYNNPPSTGSR
jgi:putative flippase GtrA